MLAALGGQDRAQATPVRGLMRLPQIGETGSTSDMDACMQETVPFDKYVDPVALKIPELSKLLTHVHMAEYVELRQLEDPGFRFGTGTVNEEVVMFTSFCNNYDVFKEELKKTAPQAWQPAIAKMGPGKIILPPPAPAPEPTAAPPPEDKVAQELEAIMAQQELQDLAAKGGWCRETLTQTVMSILQRKSTVDLQGPAQHGPAGSVAGPPTGAEDSQQNASKEPDHNTAKGPDQNTAKGPDQNTTKGPDQNTASKAADQNTASKAADQHAASKGPDQNTASKAADQNTASKAADQNAASEAADQNTATKAADQNTATKAADQNTASSKAGPQQSTAPLQQVKTESQDHDEAQVQPKRKRASYMRFYRTLSSPSDDIYNKLEDLNPEVNPV